MEKSNFCFEADTKERARPATIESARADSDAGIIGFPGRLNNANAARTIHVFYLDVTNYPYKEPSLPIFPADVLASRNSSFISPISSREISFLPDRPARSEAGVSN